METLLTLSIFGVILLAFVRNICSGRRGPQPGDGRMSLFDVDCYGVWGLKNSRPPGSSALSVSHIAAKST
jgi:hypothetical protein